MQNVDKAIRLFGLSMPRWQWAVLSLVVVASLALATQIDVELQKHAIQNGGYWLVWALVLGSGWLGVRSMTSALPAVRRWWRCTPRFRRWSPVVFVLAASVFAHAHFSHRFKVLMDEVTLVNTSQALHQHRKVFTPGNAAYRNGIFLVDEGFIDKRPFLFPFLVSVVHDLTGYRAQNGIWLNALLTPIVFTFAFLTGRQLDRRVGGGLALLLLSGVPIVAHTATGGGFEPLNLLLLMMFAHTALGCARDCSPERVGLLAAIAILLGYTRYESGLYIIAAGLLIWVLLAGSDTRRIPSVLFAAPLFCVPLVWLQLVAFSDEKGYFQLSAKNDGSAFSSEFLSGNLHSAWNFFLVPDKTNLSSPLVTVLGLVGAVIVGGSCLRGRIKLRTNRDKRPLVVATVMAATLVNAGVFLFFNYGQYSSYITQRISVPVWGIFVLVIVTFVGLQRGRFLRRLALGAALANIVIFHLPAAHGDYNTREYLEGKNCEFTLEFEQSLGSEEGVFVYSFAPAPWLAVQRPAVSFRSAPTSVEDVYELLRSGRYHRILVHILEHSETISLPVRQRYQPPSWFAEANKKLIHERWVYSGILDRIYEIEIPPTSQGQAGSPNEPLASIEGTRMGPSGSPVSAARSSEELDVGSALSLGEQLAVSSANDTRRPH